MIFLTVGSALPFDRIVKLIDQAIQQNIIADEVFAQIGAGQYVPQSMESRDFLNKDDFQDMMGKSTAVISHAGIGTIGECLKLKKPMLVMPRRKMHGELVDDHQLNTARVFAQANHLMCFETLEELGGCIKLLPNFSPETRNPNRKGISREVSAYINEFIV